MCFLYQWRLIKYCGGYFRAVTFSCNIWGYKTQWPTIKKSSQFLILGICLLTWFSCSTDYTPLQANFILNIYISFHIYNASIWLSQKIFDVIYPSLLSLLYPDLPSQMPLNPSWSTITLSAFVSLPLKYSTLSHCSYHINIQR